MQRSARGHWRGGARGSGSQDSPVAGLDLLAQLPRRPAAHAQQQLEVRGLRQARVDELDRIGKAACAVRQRDSMRVTGLSYPLHPKSSTAHKWAVPRAGGVAALALRLTHEHALRDLMRAHAHEAVKQRDVVQVHRAAQKEALTRERLLEACAAHVGQYVA
jgi:hypothetical protein